MKTFQFLIKGVQGLHARPAVMLAKVAQQYQSEIRLCCGEKAADAKDLMEVMNLNAVCGQTVSAKICGPDEEAACEGMKAYLQSSGEEDFQMQEHGKTA